MTISKKAKIWMLVFAAVIIVVNLYRYYPYKIQFAGHYDKIWAHRVNSIEKLETAQKYFDGVELDLNYNHNEDFLDVNHLPAPSIHLSFEEYLTHIGLEQKPYIWLDIKDLNIENSDRIYDRLVTLFKSKNYPKENVLIETQHPDALPKFTNSGFMTSYYLPTQLYLKDSLQLKSEILKIDQILKEQPNIGISTDYHDYEVIKTYFPNKDKYIWVLVSSFSTEFSKIKKILNDETVKVVLVNYKVLKGNR